MSKAPSNLDDYIELCEERQIEMINRIGMYLSVVQFDRPHSEQNLQTLIDWIKNHPEASDSDMVEYVIDELTSEE